MMAILPILQAPAPFLRTVSSPVATIDAEIRTLIDDMFETMYAAQGAGLTAVQIGVAKRIVVVDIRDRLDAAGNAVSNPRAFINPELLDASSQTARHKEGCLSVSGQYGNVERSDSIGARWQDADGIWREEMFGGTIAMCLQHEIDHLNGILFTDRVSDTPAEENRVLVANI